MKKIDRVGQRFNRLVVIEEHSERKNGQIQWICQCDCGNKVAVPNGRLQSNTTQSCGCLQRQRGLENITKHGLHGTREYAIWKGMRSRCNNPNRAKYKNYGARGIKVCSRWDDFASFYADMGPCPTGCSIERLDNSKGYSPDNCVWATRYVQARNKGNVNDETKFRGVRVIKNRTRPNRFCARAVVEGVEHYLGSFDTVEQAINARLSFEQDVDSLTGR